LPGRSSSSFRLLVSASGVAIAAVGCYLYAVGGYPLLTESWTRYPMRYIISTSCITRLPVLPAALVIFGLSTLVLAVKDSRLIPSLAPISLGLILTWLTAVLPPSYVFFHTIKLGFPLGFLVYIISPPPPPPSPPPVMGVVAACFLVDFAYWSTVVWMIMELVSWLRDFKR